MDYIKHSMKFSTRVYNRLNDMSVDIMSSGDEPQLYDINDDNDAGAIHRSALLQQNLPMSFNKQTDILYMTIFDQK